nr:PREDICTED: uncharacterized protein LOC108221313 [Daucus carota subsp. sativus]
MTTKRKATTLHSFYKRKSETQNVEEDQVETLHTDVVELEGCDIMFQKVKLFCASHEIEIPEMGDHYRAGRGRSRDPITIEHHFRVDIFLATIDSQLNELNHRFPENTVELLVLSSALDPTDCYKSFDIEAICRLACSYYPDDFSENDKLHLKFQLEHYILDVSQHPEFQILTTISELCQLLNKTKKSDIYPLLDRLIRLVLTLPVSTATTERAFSAMSFVKTKLRNKMEDDFLHNYLITYIEKEVAENFDNDSIIDMFYKMKNRRSQLA